MTDTFYTLSVLLAAALVVSISINIFLLRR
jgi:hypothetical protein